MHSFCLLSLDFNNKMYALTKGLPLRKNGQFIFKVFDLLTKIIMFISSAAIEITKERQCFNNINVKF